jgi:hypothetical protein
MRPLVREKEGEDVARFLDRRIYGPRGEGALFYISLRTFFFQFCRSCRRSFDLFISLTVPKVILEPKGLH